MNHLWTSILEFEGGTFVNQVEASHPEGVLADALVAASPFFRSVTSDALDEAVAEARLRDREHADAVTGCDGVFCDAVLVGGKLAMAHIVRTARHP